MKTSIVLVEDDEGIRVPLARMLSKHGYDVRVATTVAEARASIEHRIVDLVLLDIRLPDGTGLEVLRFVRELDLEIDVIIMTAFPELHTAVQALQDGARDYVIKPFDLGDLRLAIKRVLEARKLRRDVARLELKCHQLSEHDEILGEDQVVEKLRERISMAAGASTPVLVVGETGTGKELVANQLHKLSPRAAGPLIKVNCSAFTEQLLESELFGHEKGAFTGAGQSRPGLFEMADGGTLLLDEISEMRLDLQARLLRIVEGSPFRRVGGTREIATDTRVVAATSRDLVSLVESGSFRRDLLFRLNAFDIRVPPLRARGRDVVLLARVFLERAVARLRKPAFRLAEEVEQILLNYPWPGNVRELNNVIERAVILCPGPLIEPVHLPGDLRAETFLADTRGVEPDAWPNLAEMERRYVAHVVEAVGGNLSQASRVLGIARNTLKARLKT